MRSSRPPRPSSSADAIPRSAPGGPVELLFVPALRRLAAILLVCWFIGIALVQVLDSATSARAVGADDPPSGAARATSQAVRLNPPPALLPGSERCPSTGNAAVIDRDNQRAWLCTNGSA